MCLAQEPLGVYQAEQHQGCGLYITKARGTAQGTASEARPGSHAGQIDVFEAEDCAGVLAMADARGREEHRVQESHCRHVRGVLRQQLRRAAQGQAASPQLPKTQACFRR